MNRMIDIIDQHQHQQQVPQRPQQLQALPQDTQQHPLPHRQQRRAVQKQPHNVRFICLKPNYGAVST